MSRLSQSVYNDLDCVMPTASPRLPISTLESQHLGVRSTSTYGLHPLSGFLPHPSKGISHHIRLTAHDTFHVSNLKKCLADPTLKVPLNEIQVDAKLNFMEEPVEILEREFKKLKRSRIAIVKVRWNSKRGPEFTWEREDQIKLKYPLLFSDVSS
ncbi:hypothetical protein Tco_1581075 [Tanacetum coccineum]